MKKNLLILAMCLMTPLAANATTWVAIESGHPEIQAFIDTDSIKYVEEDICTYAILYKKNDGITKVVYLKSDFSKDKVGTVRVDDYVPANYKPGYYYKHNYAFLKPLKDAGFLAAAHDHAISMHNEMVKKQEESTDINIVALNDTKVYTETAREVNVSRVTYDEYLENIKSTIFENWRTSINTVNTNVNVLISINPDGSYNGYRILSSSENEKARRAAVAAVNLSAPFAPNATNDTMNVPIKFEQKLFRRYVK